MSRNRWEEERVCVRRREGTTARCLVCLYAIGSLFLVRTQPMDSTHDDSVGSSAEDDLHSLKNVVQETLERKGILANLRAQLRAAVFTAIDAEERKAGIHGENERLQSLMSSEEGALAGALFVDFLDSLQLESTKAVFEPEINGKTLRTRKDMSDQLGVAMGNSGTPLLVTLLQSLLRGDDGGYRPELDRDPLSSSAGSTRSSKSGKSPRVQRTVEHASPRQTMPLPSSKSPNLAISPRGKSPKGFSSSLSSPLPQISPKNSKRSPNGQQDVERRVRDLDDEMRTLVREDESGSLKKLAKQTQGPGSSPSPGGKQRQGSGGSPNASRADLNSSSKSLNSSRGSRTGESHSDKKKVVEPAPEEDSGSEDFYKEDESTGVFQEDLIAEEVEDDIEVEVGGESMDSVSFGESSGFLSMSGGLGRSLRSSRDKEEELSMSTSIVQDSMDLSVGQNSRALDEYDFIEKVEKP
jgi:hypothetical protein